MQIKIGIADVARELSFETNEELEVLEEKLSAALAGRNRGLFSVSDRNGRKVVVPAVRLGYIEFGSPNSQPVGFGAV